MKKRTPKMPEIDRLIIIDTLSACVKQLLHLEHLRAEGKGPIPSTLTPPLIIDIDKCIKSLRRK